MDGERLGTFARLNIRRLPSNNGRVRAFVRLDDPGQTGRLTSSTLVLQDGNFEPGADFRRAGADRDLTTMARIGDVEFAPGEVVRPLYAERDVHLSGLQEAVAATTGPEDFEMAAVTGNGGTVRAAQGSEPGIASRGGAEPRRSQRVSG